MLSHMIYTRKRQTTKVDYYKRSLVRYSQIVIVGVGKKLSTCLEMSHIHDVK